MYEHYTKRIDELIKAQESLTSGGVKSYKIGDMEITKFDMTKLDELLEEAVDRQAYYDAILHGKATQDRGHNSHGQMNHFCNQFQKSAEKRARI